MNSTCVWFSIGIVNSVFICKLLYSHPEHLHTGCTMDFLSWNIWRVIELKSHWFVDDHYQNRIILKSLEFKSIEQMKLYFQESELKVNSTQLNSAQKESISHKSSKNRKYVQSIWHILYSLYSRTHIYISREKFSHQTYKVFRTDFNVIHQYEIVCTGCSCMSACVDSFKATETHTYSHNHNQSH